MIISFCEAIRSSDSEKEAVIRLVATGIWNLETQDSNEFVLITCSDELIQTLL